MFHVKHYSAKLNNRNTKTAPQKPNKKEEGTKAIEKQKRRDLTVPPFLFYKKSMGNQPIFSYPTINYKRNIQLHGSLHLLDNNFANLLQLVRKNREVQLIVHLHSHHRLEMFLLQTAHKSNHGNLDNIGGGTLYRGIDSITLSKSPHIAIAGIDVGQKSLAMQQRLNIALLACHLNRLVHISFYLRISTEIS